MLPLSVTRWLTVVLLSWALLPDVIAQSATDSAAEKLLAQVLAEVSAKPLNATPFFERRISTMFAKPLESRGTLTYKPPSSLEKLTTSPIRERVTLTPDTMTIQAGDSAAPKVIKLDSQPGMQAFSNSLRGILAGDIKPIRQYFDAQMTGSAASWTLKLLPTDTGLKRAIKQVLVSGQGGQIKLIETTELGGDLNELTLIAGDSPQAK